MGPFKTSKNSVNGCQFFVLGGEGESVCGVIVFWGDFVVNLVRFLCVTFFFFHLSGSSILNVSRNL